MPNHPPPSRLARRLPQHSKTTLGESESRLNSRPKTKPASPNPGATEKTCGLKNWSDQVAALRALTADFLLFLVMAAIGIIILSIILTPTVESLKRQPPHGLWKAENFDDYDRPVQITPFVVPEGLAKQGYTADYLANLLRTKLVYISQVADSAAVRNLKIANLRGLPKKLPVVELPGGKIDVGELQEYVREKYTPSPHIDGYVTQNGRFLTLTLVYKAENDEKEDANKVPLPRQDHTYLVKLQASQNNLTSVLDQAMMAGALEFESYYRPIIAAYYNHHLQSTHLKKQPNPMDRDVSADLECSLCLKNAPEDDHLYAYILQGLIVNNHYIQVKQGADQARSDLKNCEKLFRQAIKEAHDFPSEGEDREDRLYHERLAEFYLGTTLEAEGKHAEAVAQFEGIPTTSWPSGLTPLFHKFWAFALIGLFTPDRINAALVRYQQRVAQQPTEEYPETLNYLGQALLYAHRAPEAERQFRSALQENPHDGTSHIYLASALEQQGKLEEALRECQQGCHLAPGDLYGKTLLENITKEIKSKQLPGSHEN